jgi:hypothetical protein
MVTDEDVRDAIELAPNLCFELPIRDVLDSEPVVNRLSDNPNLWFRPDGPCWHE